MQSRDDYESISKRNWEDLVELCFKQSACPDTSQPYLKQKDVIILRLYMTFMGLDLAEENQDHKFLSLSAQFMKDCGQEVGAMMDPERAFVVSQENKQKIKDLLVNLQKEKLLDEENKEDGSSEEGQQEGREQVNSGMKVVDSFTNMLFEALQFVNIIPNVLVNDMKAEVEELKKVAGAFNGIKNNLIDFKHLVA